jgi:hypothetical protein
MLRKLALKKLKGSDLSFFKSYFLKHPNSKQKGFNLDTKVIEGSFFPALKKLLDPLPKKAAHVDLVFLGPGLASAHSLARKVKIDAKNLRLNGELIHDPDDEPNRYDSLTVGDFAVLEFGGSAIPESVKVVLVSANNTEDATLHEVLNGKLGQEDDSMMVLSEDELQAAIDTASPNQLHPIRDWLDPVLLEEVGSGDASAVLSVNKRRLGRGISPDAFKATKEAAAKTGQLGEELMKHFLDSTETSKVASYEWISQINAISPYDFRLVITNGEIRHADAKSTSGKFDAPLYLSTAEILHALSSDVPYDIYRLYNIKPYSAELRIARDIKSKLETVFASLSALPAGARVDSLSFDPSFFTFETTQYSILFPAGD